MSVSLNKGQRVSLKKDGVSLKNIYVGLGWDTNQYSGEADFDLDASAFLLRGTGKVGRESDFVFYGNLANANGSVTHKGDNRTGSGDGDDEVIEVKLDDIPEEYESIVFTATIYDSDIRLQNFGMVSNAYIRVVNVDTEEELLRFDLSEDYSTETALVFAEIYRHSGEWKFKAIGSGYTGGLAEMCGKYGIDVE